MIIKLYYSAPSTYGSKFRVRTSGSVMAKKRLPEVFDSKGDGSCIFFLNRHIKTFEDRSLKDISLLQSWYYIWLGH